MTYHATGLLTAPTSVRTYYYGACVDAVYKEGDTTNNCSSGVRVQVGVEQTQPENNPWANVGVKVVVSATVTPGETFSMSVKLSPGYVALPATTLRLYRSPDRTITRSDTEVGTIAMEGVLVFQVGLETGIDYADGARDHRRMVLRGVRRCGDGRSGFHHRLFDRGAVHVRADRNSRGIGPCCQRDEI